MKGAILSINPKANLIDITHNCKPQDIYSSAYILSNSDYFPPGTVHLAVIDPEVGSDRKAIIVKLSNNQFYVLPDNGLLTFLLAKYTLLEAFEIENPKYLRINQSNTFHGRDIFAPIAAYASLGLNIQEFGRQIFNIKTFTIRPIEIQDTQIIGVIIYIDIFGNLISNIHKDSINRNIIKARIGEAIIENIGLKYCDFSKNQSMVIFSSEGFVEISINSGNAQKSFGIDIGATLYLELN